MGIPPSGGDATQGRLTAPQRRYLQRGLDQPGGKLPLFDENGQAVSSRTVRACIRAGLAEPWFSNPLKPDWLVCRLTEKGRRLLDGVRSVTARPDTRHAVDVG
jgi:hypothetical protein